MVIFYCCILTIGYLFEIIRGRKDLFSPRVIFNAFAWLKNVPYFYQVGLNYSEELAFKYFIIKWISFVCVNIGISLYNRLFWNGYHYNYSENKVKNSSTNTYKKIGIILFCLGILIKLYTIQRSGGIIYILTHIQSRRALLASLHYHELFSSTFLTCSVLCLEAVMLQKKSIKNRNLFFIVFIISLFTKLIYGARRPALMLILQAIMLYHYKGKRIIIKHLLSFKTIFLVAIAYFIIIMMPLLRNSSETDYIFNPNKLYRESVNSEKDIFKEFSYLAGDMFVLEHFALNDYWYGKSYKNILYQFIPSSFYKDKPPMDDGMYLYNMMCGEQVRPNEPTRQLYYSTSIPFTLEGSLFSNFGFIGVIFGCFIIGLLYQWVYKIMCDCSHPVLMILIYQQIIFVFVPSVLHTTSVLISIGIFCILLVPLFGIKISKKTNYE